MPTTRRTRLSGIGGWHRGGYYYRCASNMRYIPGVEKRTCTEKVARGDVLEYHVWNDVYELITAPAKFEARLRESQRQQQDLLKPKWDELERVNKLIAKCEEEAANCARALKSAPGEAVGNALKAEMERIEQEYARLKQRREELQAALDAKVLTDDEIVAAMEYRRDVMEGLQDPTFEDRRRVLEMLNVKVEVKNGNARIGINGDFERWDRSHRLHTSTNIQPNSTAQFVIQLPLIDLVAVPIRRPLPVNAAVSVPSIL